VLLTVIHCQNHAKFSPVELQEFVKKKEKMAESQNDLKKAQL
jgi:hypothetical protein